MIEQQLVHKCPESLRKKIATFPDASLDLILRVTEIGESQKKQIEEAGFRVRRITGIIPTFAVTGPGESLYPLLARSWLTAVELDRPVRTS